MTDARTVDNGRTILRDVVLDGAITDVVITGNRITSVVAVPAAPGDSVIECRGRRAIVPPFYNSHTHAGMTLLRGYAEDLLLDEWLTEHIWPAEAQLTDAEIEAGVRLAIMEMIKSGTVFFNDMYWNQLAAARAAADLGVRAMIGLLYFSGPDGLADPRCQRSNEELLGAAPDLPDRVGIALAPHSVYTVSEALLAEVAGAAQQGGMWLHTHASETQAEVADCLAAHGVTPIGLLDRVGALGPRTVLAHGTHMTAADRDLIATRGAVISHQPTSNMKLCAGSFDLASAQSAGIRLALGTDGAASNNSLSMLSEMKIGSLTAKRRDQDPRSGRAADLWTMATAGGADAFEIEAGRIAVGQLADALLIDLEQPAMIADHDLVTNLVHSADSTVVDTVICDGRVLMAGRVVPGEAEIVAAARDAAARVRARRDSGATTR